MNEITAETQCDGCGEFCDPTEQTYWVALGLWLCRDCDADEREDGDTDPFGEFDEDDEIEIDLDVCRDCGAAFCDAKKQGRMRPPHALPCCNTFFVSGAVHNAPPTNSPHKAE